MAMINCDECGKAISDKAGVCPNCGYPIQAIRNAQIEQQKQKYYKDLNKTLTTLNILAFLTSLAISIVIYSQEVETWAWIVYFAALAIFLWLCFSWKPWILAVIYNITHRKYKEIPKAFVIISICVGYVLGGCIGMGLH